VFNVEGGARIIGGVDISGRRNLESLGERIQFSPGISVEAAGGPLPDAAGKVVAVLGGSAVPGSRFVDGESKHNETNSSLSFYWTRRRR